MKFNISVTQNVDVTLTASDILGIVKKVVGDLTHVPARCEIVDGRLVEHVRVHSRGHDLDRGPATEDQLKGDEFVRWLERKLAPGGGGGTFPPGFRM